MRRWSRAVAWRVLLAAGMFVAGAVAAFATVYAVGWREAGGEGATTRAPERMRRVYTLRDGDIVVRPEAATRCEASGEAGVPNLFCTRIPRGRHQIIFYDSCVLVWPLARGPDGPPFVYRWMTRERGCF